MSKDGTKYIGLIIGSETDWPDAFLAAINNEHEGVQAELVQLGGTFMDHVPPYQLIIDRMSHKVPYYRAYVKHAALNGSTVINDPFTWSADDKFFGTAIANRLGLTCPRTVVLPNKDIADDLTPDCFRNLDYPMNWQGIIDYVGVPAIFKDIHSGGRPVAYRVHNVDELIDRYDETGQRTMILQEVIESDTHIHCLVIGQTSVLTLSYSLAEDKYLPDTGGQESFQSRRLADAALAITRAYGYDINMVEFVVREERAHVINSTNPVPVIDLELLTREQFEWCVAETVKMAIKRVRKPPTRRLPFSVGLA